MENVRSRLDGIGGFVDVVTVKAQARLQAQRIARAKPDRRDVGMIEQFHGEVLDDRGGQRDFEAILAGVARSCDINARALIIEGAPVHEFQLFDAGKQNFQRVDGAGALQGQHRARFLNMQRDLRKPFRDQREIPCLRGGVDDEKQALVAAGQACRHQIVEYAAGLVQQLRVARALRRELFEIGRR